MVDLTLGIRPLWSLSSSHNPSLSLCPIDLPSYFLLKQLPTPRPPNPTALTLVWLRSGSVRMLSAVTNRNPISRWLKQKVNKWPHEMGNLEARKSRGTILSPASWYLQGPFHSLCPGFTIWLSKTSAKFQTSPTDHFARATLTKCPDWELKQ